MKTNKFIELTNVTEKYNKLSEELTILNSYKTIFGIN